MTASDKLIDGPTAVPTATTSEPSSAHKVGKLDAKPMVFVPAYLFYVKIDGVGVAMFTECSGIGAKRNTESFREGGVNEYAHILPGPVEYSNITLKRGLSVSSELWDWFQTGKFDFNVARHTVTIIQAAPDMPSSGGASGSGGNGSSSSQAGTTGIATIKTWTLANAFPVSWKLADMSTSNSQIVIETLEIAHEGISLQQT